MDTQTTQLRPSRADVLGAASPFNPALPFLALLVVGISFPLFGGGYWGVIATRACVYWVLVSGLNLVVGFGGQIAIGWVALLTLGPIPLAFSWPATSRRRCLLIWRWRSRQRSVPSSA